MSGRTQNTQVCQSPGSRVQQIRPVLSLVLPPRWALWAPFSGKGRNNGDAYVETVPNSEATGKTE